MVIKKVLSENVSEHHPEQALLITDTGDVYITKKDRETEGYPLITLISHEDIKNQMEVIAETRVNQVVSALRGNNYSNGGYESSC